MATPLVDDLITITAYFARWPSTLRLCTLGRTMAVPLYNTGADFWRQKVAVECAGLIPPDIPDFRQYYWMVNQQPYGRLVIDPIDPADRAKYYDAHRSVSGVWAEGDADQGTIVLRDSEGITTYRTHSLTEHMSVEQTIPARGITRYRRHPNYWD